MGFVASVISQVRNDRLLRGGEEASPGSSLQGDPQINFDSRKLTRQAGHGQKENSRELCRKACQRNNAGMGNYQEPTVNTGSLCIEGPDLLLGSPVGGRFGKTLIIIKA
jgi:hypothetical protein